MEKNAKWKNFFQDPNVRFPEKPRLLNEIHIYEAPYGLGVQFNGGPHPLIIRGKNVGEIFSALKQRMDGALGWEQLVLDLSKDFEIDEVIHVLRILQANSLLRDGVGTNGEVENPQTQYYNRVLGRSGFLKKGSDVYRIISSVKLLLLSEGMMAELLLEHLLRVGFKAENLTLFVLSDVNRDIIEKMGVKLNLLDQSSIKACEANLQKIVGSYRFVISALPNPSDWFVNSLNRIAIIENVPTFYLSKQKEFFEIGPYVIPKRTSCIFCKTMRSNSYNEDAPIENSYQDLLKEKQMVIGDSAKGDDYISTLAATSIFLGEVVKVISGYAANGLINGSYSYDIINGFMKKQMILRIPGCPECN